jgi:hypothetical protein
MPALSPKDGQAESPAQDSVMPTAASAVVMIVVAAVLR